MLNLSVVIPDYKSSFLDQTIESVLLINPDEIIISNFKTSYTESLEKKYKDNEKIKFLNFDCRKNPGDYRNCGAERATKKYILFVDSDILINEKTIKFIEINLNKIDEAKIFWGVYSTSSKNNILQDIQIKILRYRFSEKFFNLAKKNNKPYCGQSSHFIITRELFNKLGGFNPYLRMREDNDFCIRAKLIGAQNILCNDFEASHLKKFEIINDYFVKPYHSVKVKILEPKIFNQPYSQIGKSLFFQWLFCPIIFALTAIFFIDKINFINIFFAYLLILYLTIPRFLKKSFNFFEKLIYIFLCPFIGLNFIIGGLSGLGHGLIIKVNDLIKFLFDYIKILFKVIYRNGNPIQIVNFITARCNLRCNHCFYKDTLDAPNPGEMNLNVIDNYTKKFGSILWYALGGGEPFIRKDIPQLYETVQKNCSSKVFTIPTNGWYVQKIYLSVLRMLQFARNNNIIIIQFSIDGQQKVHDQIRGKDSFQKVKDSIKRLQPLQKIYSNLHFSIITVVNNENREIYPNFIDELVELGTNQVNINLFRYLDYEHPKVPDETIERYKLAVERYEDYIKQDKLMKYSFIGAKLMRLKEALQKDLIYDVAKHDKFVTPCTAGTLSYVIWEDGRVNACEILNDEIGNLNQEKISNNFFQSDKATNLRKKIKDTKCRCTYECAMSTNTFFSWNMTKKMIKAYITNRV